MATINIPFNKWSRERILSGQKTCTSRSKKYGQESDQFQVIHGPNHSTVHNMMMIMQLPLSFVRDFLWHGEGANSPFEFVQIWKEIHPRRGFVEEDLVYVHFFTNPRAIQ